MIAKIVTFIKTRLLVFLPTLLGIVETAIKFLKEALTLVVDILYPIIPNAAFKVVVTKIRNIVDVIYDWINKNKEKLLTYLKLI
jgi:hypothetical protein